MSEVTSSTRQHGRPSLRRPAGRRKRRSRRIETGGSTASRPTADRPAPGRQAEDVVAPVLDDGDHDRFAHYVRKDTLQLSRTSGTPVRALCGKVWVPDRDPNAYPVCPTCKEIAGRWQQRGAN